MRHVIFFPLRPFSSAIMRVLSAEQVLCQVAHHDTHFKTILKQICRAKGNIYKSEKIKL